MEKIYQFPLQPHPHTIKSEHNLCKLTRDYTPQTPNDFIIKILHLVIGQKKKLNFVYNSVRDTQQLTIHMHGVVVDICHPPKRLPELEQLVYNE